MTTYVRSTRKWQSHKDAYNAIAEELGVYHSLLLLLHVEYSVQGSWNEDVHYLLASLVEDLMLRVNQYHMSMLQTDMTS